VEITDNNHARIEAAYQKYFYRADSPPILTPEQLQVLGAGERHEYEIIVCHANVIRYFVCRALQIPPEAWLRMCPFNCSLTYLTIRPTGSVSLRMLGDIGHLPQNTITFSGHYGYNW
jgi:serine/threonine-protein phosphatase PGAM5